ncbi:hypothetical protein [Ensifer sp. 4252]|uniref:hypothetical protein n=1 Tax=Ensifer sp. 4252 TaxID=3373915 RepID=UPI003D25BCE0
MKNLPQTDSWRSGLFTAFDIATALGESPAALAGLFNCDTLKRTRQAACAGKAEHFELNATARTSLAIIHSLRCHVGLAPRIAEQALLNWPQIAVSVARIVDFEPDTSNDIGARLEPAPAADPLQFFGRFAEEPLPVAMLDEYIDLIDGRYLLWRRPKCDPHRIATAIHASQERLRLDPQDAAAQADFLEAAAVVRRSPEHEMIWLGSVRGELFCPTPAANSSWLPERLPSTPMIDEASNVATLATSYRSKHSVNISLAARAMKRRALGLTVR